MAPEFNGIRDAGRSDLGLDELGSAANQTHGGILTTMGRSWRTSAADRTAAAASAAQVCCLFLVATAVLLSLRPSADADMNPADRLYIVAVLFLVLCCFEPVFEPMWYVFVRRRITKAGGDGRALKWAPIVCVPVTYFVILSPFVGLFAIGMAALFAQAVWRFLVVRRVLTPCPPDPTAGTTVEGHLKASSTEPPATDRSRGLPDESVGAE